MMEEKKSVEIIMNLLTNGWDDVYVKGINRILAHTKVTGLVVSEEHPQIAFRSIITLRVIVTDTELKLIKNGLKNILGIDKYKEKYINLDFK